MDSGDNTHYDAGANMLNGAREFQETTINGPRTRRWALEAKEYAEFDTRRIARIGIDVAHAPYNRVRLSPAGSFFLACLEGEGRMLLEGRWQRVAAGALCMAPPRVLNALHAVPGNVWTFAWIRYEEPRWIKPLVGAESPLRLRTGAEEIGRVIAGLRAEWEGARDPALCHHWASLLHALAERAASPWRGTSRLSELWKAVVNDMAHDWTLHTLSERCHMSAEHLRRVCVLELGRTPMEHVTYIRMQRARELLEARAAKLEAIAPEVGYHSATVFSRAFMRVVGMTPSDYRARR